MRAALGIGLFAVLLGGDACDCNRDDAACQQTLIALCEYEAVCRGVDAIDVCEAARGDFTCTVDVEAAGVCVEAINAVLAADCADPPADLPCPLLTQSGLYQPCGGDLVCADERQCLVADGTSLCSERCDDDDPCPAGGGCAVEERVCGPACGRETDFRFDCAITQFCFEGRCRECADECNGCDDVVDECDCAVAEGCAVACVDDGPCGGGVCVGGFCE